MNAETKNRLNQGGRPVCTNRTSQSVGRTTCGICGGGI